MSKSIEATNERIDYVIPRTRQHALAPVYWNAALQTNPMVAELYGKTLSVEYNFFSDGMMNTVIPRKDWESVGNYIASRMINEPAYFEHLSLETEKAKEKILSYLKDTEDGETVEDLVREAYQIRDLFFEYDSASVFAWFVAGDPFHREVAQILRLSEEDFSDVSMPDVDSYASEMERVMLEYALSDNETVDHYAEILAKKYYWIPFGYDGPEIWNADYFSDKICDLRLHPELAKRMLEERYVRIRKQRERLEVIEATFHDDAEKQRLIWTMRTLARWTDERKMLEYQLFVRYRKILEKIGELSGMSIEVLKFLFTEELPSSTSDISKLTDLAKRRMAEEFMTVSRGGETHVAGRKETDQIRHSIAFSGTSGTVSGVVASRGPSGRYIARVKILHSAKDAEKVEEGDLLVTFMTTPDYVLPMTRAVGFITDEGGVTCHAAIVAREMNKPCLIGTRCAARVFRDGDLVELDTDHGIARVQERAVSEQWVKRWERDLKLQKAADYILATGDPFAREYGRGTRLMYVRKENNPSAIYEKPSLRKEFDNHYSKQFYKPDFLRSLNDFEAAYEPHLRFLEDLRKKNLKRLSDSDLLRTFRVYKKSFLSFNVPLWTVVIWEPIIENILYALLSKRYSGETLQKHIETVLSPTKANYILREELDLAKISDLPEGKREAALERHTEKYEYIPMYDYDTTPYTKEHFRKRLEDINKDSVREKERIVRENGDRLEEMLLSGDFDEQERKILETLHYLCNHKDERSHYRSLDSYLAKGLYEELARRAKMRLGEVLFLLDEEIERAVSGESFTSQIAERSKGYALFQGENGMIVLSGRAMHGYLDSAVKEDTKAELRGMGVSKGTASGLVRIVRSSADLLSLRDGDILVTSMTRPEYVSAMKRCRGIVTNEGSVLCHAAIVSRELKIPCVVGTHDVTTLLHDGDMVEVDADQGTVRVLERAVNEYSEKT